MGDEKTFLSQGAFGLEILWQLSAGELPLKQRKKCMGSLMELWA